MGNELFFVNVFPPNDRQSTDFDYRKSLEDVVKYSTDMQFKYTLMTIGDKRMDPWVLAQRGMEISSAYSPLVAVNPFYQHPLHVVKKIISLKHLYKSKIAINLVTGSFFSELKSLKDDLTFEERSERLIDFFQSMQSLINQDKKTHSGSFYTVEPAEVFPKYTFEKFDFFVSGSQMSALNTCKEAHFVQSIRPLEEMPAATTQNCGLGIGVCARETREEALKEMKRLYPDDRKGEMLFHLSLANSSTPWNRWFKNYIANNSQERADFYLKPMTNFWCSSPFVVGTYQEVADRIRAYGNLGYKFFILDFVPEEAGHVKKILEIIRSTKN